MKKIADERVVQESHGVMAKNFRTAMLLLALLLVVKAVGVLIGLPWHALLPEACGLLCGGVVWGIWKSVRGLWGTADERIAAERQVCLSTSWTVTHCVALLVCTVMMFLDRDNSMAYMLTALAMTLIMYCTMGRMTQKGVYGAGNRGSVWQRVALIAGITLVLAPAMLWLMGKMRQQTYEWWMYILVEAIMLGSCVLGGVLAQRMAKRSAANAEEQLKAAEDADEE